MSRKTDWIDLYKQQAMCKSEMLEKFVKDCQIPAIILCSLGKCVCMEHGDCPGQLLCQRRLFAPNRCVECLKHKQCHSTAYCNQGQCQKKKSNGRLCLQNEMCRSGRCSWGFCIPGGGNFAVAQNTG